MRFAYPVVVCLVLACGSGGGGDDAGGGSGGAAAGTGGAAGTEGGGGSAAGTVGGAAGASGGGTGGMTIPGFCRQGLPCGDIVCTGGCVDINGLNGTTTCTCSQVTVTYLCGTCYAPL